MLGHKLCQVFRLRFETWATVRRHLEPNRLKGVFDGVGIESGIDANHFDSIAQAIDRIQPEVVVNCIGIIKQLREARDPILSLMINSVLPHRLMNFCQARGMRLIQISTDCVFSGRKGYYRETDPADAEDLYGRSKLLGEIECEGGLTIRTSIIGRELATQHGLVEWFLSNRGKCVRGFTQAIYSGFPTVVLARLLQDVIERQPNLCGLYHVSSAPISKYELLVLLRAAYGIQVEIEPDTEFACNRALDSTRFWAAVKSAPPPWPEMIHALAEDWNPYED
jgi:dTDP-4-dehydrorhamnose reductase